MSLDTPNFTSLELLLQNWSIHLPLPNPKRLVHGRGGLFPGLSFLTLDAYGAMLIAIIHLELAMEDREILFNLLSKYSPKGVLQDRSCRPKVFHWNWGDIGETENIAENDLFYQMQFGARQNFGFFPDMIHARAWVKNNVRGLKVLNLFAFTCSFSVAAIAGQAHSVVNVDMSGTSLETGRTNHRINQQDLSRIQFLKLDILKSWGRIARLGPYDLIICDPPTHQSASFDVDKDYSKVLRRLAPMLNPNGLILACLNSPHHTYADLMDWIEPESPLKKLDTLERPEDFKNVHIEQGLKIIALGLH